MPRTARPRITSSTFLTTPESRSSGRGRRAQPCGRRGRRFWPRLTRQMAGMADMLGRRGRGWCPPPDTTYPLAVAEAWYQAAALCSRAASGPRDALGVARHHRRRAELSQGGRADSPACAHRDRRREPFVAARPFLLLRHVRSCCRWRHRLFYAFTSLGTGSPSRELDRPDRISAGAAADPVHQRALPCMSRSNNFSATLVLEVGFGLTMAVLLKLAAARGSG